MAAESSAAAAAEKPTKGKHLSYPRFLVGLIKIATDGGWLYYAWMILLTAIWLTGIQGKEAGLKPKEINQRIDDHQLGGWHAIALGSLAGQPFAAAQVKGRTCPAPVIYLRLDGDKGLGVAAVFAEVFQVARRELAVDGACSVLAAHRDLSNSVRRDGPKRSQHLDFFTANRVCVQAGGRFHGDQAQQLQQVVLHHVAECAGAVVKGRAAAGAQVLRHRDLDAVDITTVHQGFENRIGEPQQ